MSGTIQTTSPVTFDYLWFQARYPELSEWCNPDMASGYFDLACTFLDNTGLPNPTGGQSVPCYWIGSPVTDVPTRQRLLGLLTAHIAKLFAPVDGNPSAQTVGRIASAGEGSVNVSFEFATVPGQEWYAQTKYGAMFWAATARYRMARYYPGPQPFGEFSPFGSFGRRGGAY